MENKGKPQGFRKVKLLRWLCIDPLPPLLPNPPSSPCLQPQSAQPLLEILVQTRLRKVAGCSCWDFLHGTSLLQERGPITQDETANTLQCADQHYRKDVCSEVTLDLRTKYKSQHSCDALSMKKITSQNLCVM